MSTYQEITGSKFPIKAWVEGVALEEPARQQLHNVANLPFIHRWVAAVRAVAVGSEPNPGMQVSPSQDPSGS